MCCHHLLVGRLCSSRFLWGFVGRRAVLWLALGDFLLSNGTKRGLEDSLVYGGSVFRFLGLTTSLLAGPASPFSSSCPRGCCLPVLLPVGSLGVRCIAAAVFGLCPTPFGLALSALPLGLLWVALSLWVCGLFLWECSCQSSSDLCLILRWHGSFPALSFLQLWGMENSPILSSA